MLAQAPIIGFVPSSDLVRSEHFYAGKLGLAIEDKNPFAIVFTAPGGSSIRCIQAPPFTPQAFTVLGWEVPDIHAAVKSLKGKGVAPILYPHFEQSPDGVWTAPGGDQVAWFHDPDNNILSLSQHVKSAGKAKA